MTDETVFQLLMATNPVPDPDGLDSPMAAFTPPKQGSPRRTGRGIATHEGDTGMGSYAYGRDWLRTGVATAVVLLLGLGTWVALGGSDGEEVAPEVNVVLAAFDAWNAGDFEGFLAAFTDDLAQAEMGGVSRIIFNAGSEIEIVEPCHVVETSATGSTVQCGIVERNGFHGPAGISNSSTSTFVVDLAGKITHFTEVGTCCSAEFTFQGRFWAWLADSYPNVYERIRPIDGQSLPGWEGDPADMLVAIQYVEEFIAQSIDYPLGR